MCAIIKTLDIVLERLHGEYPSDEPPINSDVHMVHVIGGMSASIGLTLILLGLFQPSSNARKFALVSFALLQYLNYKTHYKYPINEEDGPPELSITLGLMGIALVGALFSKTDGERRQIVRSRKKAELYTKHASSKAAKAD